MCHEISQDAINGTQVPDLGPKFYIARPLLRQVKADWQTGYQGFTFTPLHCDLADAVNYSCFGEAALWQIFRRDDRKSELPAIAQLPLQIIISSAARKAQSGEHRLFRSFLPACASLCMATCSGCLSACSVRAAEAVHVLTMQVFIWAILGGCVSKAAGSMQG